MELNPDNLQAWHDLGIALLMQNRPEEAIEEFHEVLRRDPTFIEACDNLAAVCRGQKKYDQALQYC